MEEKNRLSTFVRKHEARLRRFLSAYRRCFSSMKQTRWLTRRFPIYKPAQQAHQKPGTQVADQGSAPPNRWHHRGASHGRPDHDPNREGSERPFEVRGVIHDKLSNLRKGESVILLVDKEDKVIDVAVPPHSR